MDLQGDEVLDKLSLAVSESLVPTSVESLLLPLLRPTQFRAPRFMPSRPPCNTSKFSAGLAEFGEVPLPSRSPLSKLPTGWAEEAIWALGVCPGPTGMWGRVPQCKFCLESDSLWNYASALDSDITKPHRMYFFPTWNTYIPFFYHILLGRQFCVAVYFQGGNCRQQALLAIWGSEYQVRKCRNTCFVGGWSNTVGWGQFFSQWIKA